MSSHELRSLHTTAACPNIGVHLSQSSLRTPRTPTNSVVRINDLNCLENLCTDHRSTYLRYLTLH
ncbi:hypothetical protein LIA77_07497 [Sarocladium implicatum]|nr:hypothetical protein LIA77_07497 [Sarocladium implicatum]